MEATLANAIRCATAFNERDRDPGEPGPWRIPDLWDRRYMYGPDVYQELYREMTWPVYATIGGSPNNWRPTLQRVSYYQFATFPDT